MADYTLPSLVTVNGTFAIEIKNCPVGSLTEPTIQTILSIDSTDEVLDIEAVTSEVSQLTLSIRDDYSTYTDGFWYEVFNGTITEVLSGDIQINITLDEGSGATHFFYGTLNRESIDWSEIYVSTTKIRTAKIVFDSMVRTLLDSVLSDWIDDLPSYGDATEKATPTGASKVIDWYQFFESLLYKSGLNPDASAPYTDVTFVIGTPDFKYSLATVEYGLEELRIATHYDSGGGDTLTDYFLSSKSDYIPKRYDTVQGFLSDLCKNLAIALRLSYSSGRHTLAVMQRGRAYTGEVTFGTPERLKKSSIVEASDIQTKYIRVTRLIDSSKFIATDQAGALSVTVPYSDKVEFGVDFNSVFGVDEVTPEGVTFGLFSGGNYGDMEQIDEIEVYNYDDDVYEGYPHVGETNYIMERACAYYYYHRYAAERKRIVRTYSGLTAHDGVNESHEHIHILRRIAINDGTGAANYFANRVTKKPDSSEVEVEWIEE